MKATARTADDVATTDFKIIIPARYDSTRLPGKPLRLVNDRPLIEHTYRSAQHSAASEIIVATDDARIAECVEGFGGQCCMTRADHESGSDRIAEVAEQRGLSDDTILVNLQGDEPLLEPDLIDTVAASLHARPEISIATAASREPDTAQQDDPNKVKVVCTVDGLALYFSRAAIPWRSETWLWHYGIYAYRCGYLKRFTTLDRPHIEQSEKLEQLRALVAGDRIYIQEFTARARVGVDSEDDLVEAAKLLTD